MNNNNHNHHRSLPAANDEPRQLGLPVEEHHGESADEAQIEFSEIWNAMRRGKWIILLTTVIVTAAILVYTLMLPPTYEAGAIVAIDPPQGSAVSTRITGYGQPTGLSQQLGVLRHSVALAARVAEDLKRRADSTGAGAAVYPILYSEDGALLSDREVAHRLSEHVSFEAMPEQRMIRIVAQSREPEQAAAIANFYAEEYQRYSREQARASIAATEEYLRDQVVEQKQALREVQEEWAQFAQESQLMVLGEASQTLVGQYVSLQTEQRRLSFELNRARAMRESLQERLQEIRPQLRTEITQEQEAQSLQQRIAALDQKIAQLRTQESVYYINYPALEDRENLGLQFAELSRIRQQIEGLTQRRAELQDRFISQTLDQDGLPGGSNAVGFAGQLRAQIMDVQSEINVLQAQMGAVEEALGGYSGRLQGIPQQVIQRRRIERRRAQTEQLYNTLMAELNRVVIAQEGKLGYIQVVRQARAPAFPVSPNLTQNLMLGLLLGLGFGIGLAFIRQAANTYFHKPEDVQEQGYSLVGVIPEMDREVKAAFDGQEQIDVNGHALSTNLMPLLNPWSPISENYRLVRTNLQFSGGADEVPQVLLVTSPEVSDGKTLTSVNLAITLAQSGRRVLLVDADLRRPAAHRFLGRAQGPGLVDLLRSKERPLSERVQPTAVENLHFLGAGRTDEPPAEMLGSGRLQEVLDEARSRYDAVLIDSPPVLAVSDPILTAKRCDATLVVISAERTDLRALEVTRKTLAAVGVPIAGVVFNRFEAERQNGYGYGYSDEYEGYTHSAA